MSSSRRVSDGLRQAAAKAPEKSNFLQTCNLLSRYIKEKGSLRDLNLEIGGKVESLDSIVKPGSSLSASASAAVNSNSQGNPGKSAKQTIPQQQPSMDSYPQVPRPDSSSIIPTEDSSNKTSTSKEGTTTDLKHSQLTIFYSGRVLVFDDYPADKARELVSIAKRSSSQMSYGILPPNTNITQEKPNPYPRDGLPPRPGKQTVGIASNIYNKEKSNPATSGAHSAREGLPPRPQPAGSKQLVGIPPDSRKEKAKTSVGGASAAVASSFNAVKEQASPAQSEANGSGHVWFKDLKKGKQRKCLDEWKMLRNRIERKMKVEEESSFLHHLICQSLEGHHFTGFLRRGKIELLLGGPTITQTSGLLVLVLPRLMNNLTSIVSH